MFNFYPKTKLTIKNSPRLFSGEILPNLVTLSSNEENVYHKSKVNEWKTESTKTQNKILCFA